MKYRSECINTRVRITKQESAQAKELAKSKGMTFQGWLGQLIKRELAKSQQDQLSVDP